MYNFFSLDPASYHIRMFSYKDLVGWPELWDLLGDRGYRCGIVNNPIAYPPRPVNGYMVAGFRAPSVRHGYTWPPELRERLDQVAGGYEIDLPAALDPDELVANALRVMAKRQKVFMHLLLNKPTDFFLGVFTVTDRVCHHLLNQSREGILPLYRALDANLASIKERLRPEDRLLVVSDHGFIRRTHGFLINQWLVDQGYLKLKPGQDRLERVGLTVKRLRDARDRWGLKDSRLAARILGFLNRYLPFGTLEGEGRSIIDLIKRDRIDWARTRAVAIPDGIYLNTLDRPLGIVSTGEEVQKLRAEIRNRLQQVYAPSLGRRLRIRTYSPEELYWGPHVDRAPDILWSIEDWSWGTIWNMSNSAAWFAKLELAHHHPDGMFMALGPGIGPGARISGAEIIDLAPTILQLMGVPIPTGMDGQVLEQIMSSKGKAHRRIHLSGEACPARVPASEIHQSRDGNELAVWERLRGLGYLD
jgi:predicted AlkP superfamily phosphohydrolase/phosphomutase